MVADEEKPVSGSLGLLAKARSERELLIAELYEHARYDGVVEIRIAGTAARRRCRPTPSSARVRCRSQSTSIPARSSRLATWRSRATPPTCQPATFGLVRGGPAGSEAILKAEGLIVRALKEEGRPLAKVTEREIVADHATLTLDVTLTVEAGPIAGYGETIVEGTEDGRPRLHRLHGRAGARRDLFARRDRARRASGSPTSACSAASASPRPTRSTRTARSRSMSK